MLLTKLLSDCKFFLLLVFSAGLLTSCAGRLKESGQPTDKPNVLLIMTDDQGIGDFGFNGNPYIRTPNLDSLAAHSLNLTSFYVSPVCAPTRASLMTGKFSERTGVYDTYNGGAIMSSDEITLAEILKENGYNTGVFGKWHLGDNYPYRPTDQGFEVSAVHLAGGIGQPGDILNYFAKDSSYFDPVLMVNNLPTERKGYCSDVFTREAIEFIKDNQKTENNKPFFAYLAFNAPHTPLQVPEEYYQLYQNMVFQADSFGIYDEAVERMSTLDIESAKKVYGMVTNIDDNIGELIRVLKEENIYDNTLIVFLTDNGPQQVRYKLGLRRRKSSVYSGGIKVPCLIHHPVKFNQKTEFTANTAHIDLLPSIIDFCNIEMPDHTIDGISIFSEDSSSYSAFDERTLFFEWGRGYLTRYQNFAALKGDHKLVGNTSHSSDVSEFELYNIKVDPFETNNIIMENTKLANELKSSLDNWYEEIIADPDNRGIFPGIIGTTYENPVLLNRNDAKGTPPPWIDSNNLNSWDIKALEDGVYNIRYFFLNTSNKPGKLILRMYPYHFVLKQNSCLTEHMFKELSIKKGDYKFEPCYLTNEGEIIFPFYVSIQRTDIDDN